MRTPAGRPMLLPESRVFSRGSVVLGVPVAEEDGVVVSRGLEGNRDEEAAVNPQPAEAAGRLVHPQRREVEEAANLVLHLEMVCKVGPWQDRAVGSRHFIKP
ncbi:hypothetical protein ZIOFF_009665 [Zingiber officinale]|uniref:Uncharacterized protein n=1 Tax=Zingiber officinale TaxID=94328 RepID=A0A8J5LYK2_ZINOF|nr:hypothetical protein ZIOFF_009665 [Zingiber officinale]